METILIIALVVGAAYLLYRNRSSLGIGGGDRNDPIDPKSK